MTSEREMTLEEWVNRLPGFHFAHREYVALRARAEQAPPAAAARLTPDRERVARVLHDAEKGWSNNLDDARTWQAACADALIAAMEGK